MIIDFHTHSFPEKIADRVMVKLSESARAAHYLDGTLSALSRSMQEAGIDYSVLLPVATSASQQSTINKTALKINERSYETGILSFGGIHPDNGDYRTILRSFARAGIKGIKLHPVFQGVAIDDIRFLRIMECACENDLIILTHAGYDISFPECEYASPQKIAAVLDTLRPPKMVLAHMGGWGCLGQVEEYIVGRDVWLDTAYSLIPITAAPGTTRKPEENPPLTQEQFLRLVHRHGVHRILFGTDSPWDIQSKTLEVVQKSGLTAPELDAVLGQNAAALLNLKS